MTIRDWVGMLLFFPGVLLQLAAFRICGPHGRKLINEAVSDAAREIFREVEVRTLTEAEEEKIQDKLPKVPF